MDGVEAGEYIHAHWGIPVVYMTAYPDAWRAARWVLAVCAKTI
jgi:hypothetical protein